MQNWGRNVTFEPASVRYPKNTAEVIAIVEEAKKQTKLVRVLGARHSFSPLIVSSDIIIDPSAMRGLISVDKTNNTASFHAGTPIREVGPLLAPHGLALPNQGDIDSQTLAGAVSTGTHGTGIAFGSLSSMVTALEFVDGCGQIKTIDQNTEDDLLSAAQVALGTFGVLTKVTIRCDASFILSDQRRRASLDTCLSDLPNLMQKHRHFEFFWFPGSSLVQIKTLDVVSERRPRSNFGRWLGDEIIEKSLYRGLCELTALCPAMSQSTSRLCGRLIPGTDYADQSHLVYPSSREVRFTEMEYAVPLEKGAACFEEIRRMIARENIRVFFPVEFRVAAADNAWISPFYGRQSAIISLHVFKNIDETRYFSAAEPIFKAFGGRPHWGKIHNLTLAEIRGMYPRWQQFADVRKAMDPTDTFLNPMLQRYFQTETTT